jgi:hypothetical protein
MASRSARRGQRLFVGAPSIQRERGSRKRLLRTRLRRATPLGLWILLALMLLVMIYGVLWETKYGHRPPAVAQPRK